jgi:hypothetical protein
MYLSDLEQSAASSDSYFPAGSSPYLVSFQFKSGYAHIEAKFKPCSPVWWDAKLC